ncbi:alcohol dehydrogenase catalytic domain-containing protein [Novosphingobium sp. 1529]|uniref:alcohol dehydrogenase catalytic domain-containing protein n=1 Tax=Novosphingobium sp. 1529 TaxID=3156424 RepID=UPI0033907B17
MRHQPAFPERRRSRLCARSHPGHEDIGTIEAIGAAVGVFNAGDRLLISCISSCGNCKYGRTGMYSHCTSAGWILGKEIDGTQAEYVRIPLCLRSRTIS